MRHSEFCGYRWPVAAASLVVAMACWLPGTRAAAAFDNCGNGRMDEFEQCDDANTANGDGCSSLCQREGDDFPVLVYQAGDAVPTPALEDLPLLSTVAQHGITWTFASPQRVGRFVNGDYYVVGDATIVDIQPLPTTTNGLHGSMLNIRPNLNRSGFDSRIEQGRYDASLRVYPPIQLTVGNQLLSSRSAGSTYPPCVMRPNDTCISPVASVSILTSLAATQPLDAFRPSYARGSDRVYRSRELRRQLLPRLAPVQNTPPVSEFAGYLKRPWVDAVFFEFATPGEYMTCYGREHSYLMSFAGLLLTLDLTEEEKEPLLVYLVQYGIDLHGMVEQGQSGWQAHGGHGNGRKFPFVFTEIMLAGSGMPAVQARFSEDQQTIWVAETPPAGSYSQTWHTRPETVAFGGHAGIDGESVKPGWGPYEHLPPSQWIERTGETYRRCCTSVSWVGEALAARLIPGMQAAWDHPQFFAYVDRWMTSPDDPADLEAIRAAWGWTVVGDFQQGYAWKILSGGGYYLPHKTFVDEMWSAYRDHATQEPCAALAGSCCASGQLCAGGSFAASADCGLSCCVGGTCEDPADTCQGLGFQCCPACGQDPQPAYDADCGGQVCCGACAGCGDGQCSGTESCTSCPADCPTGAGEVCADGLDNDCDAETDEGCAAVGGCSCGALGSETSAWLPGSAILLLVGLTRLRTSRSGRASGERRPRPVGHSTLPSRRLIISLEGSSVIPTLTLLGLTLAFCWFLPGRSQAANWYVRPNGGAYGAEDGTNWGNTFDGFSDIGWSSIRPGDTICIAGGIYTSSLTIGASGTEGQSINIRRAIGNNECSAAADWSSAFDSQVELSGPVQISIDGVHDVLISGEVEDGIFKGPSDSANPGVYIRGSQRVVLRYISQDDSTTNLVVRSYRRGFNIASADGLLISHCKINNFGNDAFALADLSNSIIEHCEIGPRYFTPEGSCGSSSGGCHGDGFEVRTVDNITIRNNLFQWAGDNFMMGGASYATGRMVVHGNVFTGGNSAIKLQSTTLNGQGPLFVYNNVFTGRWSAIGTRWELFTGGEFQNNIVYGPGGISVGYGTLSHSNNYYETGYVPSESGAVSGGDPFVGLAVGDFRLRGTSVAVDAGVDLGPEYAEDRAGNQRGADGAWDIGAYEYVGDCDGDGQCGGTENCTSCQADCPTGAGEVCCSGSLFAGDCCASGDCSPPEVCTNHVCAPGPCADADGDGHTDAACEGNDCNDSDRDVHPGAAEICDDGVDSDCDGRECGGEVAGGCGCRAPGGRIGLLGLILGCLSLELLRRRRRAAARAYGRPGWSDSPLVRGGGGKAWEEDS